MVKIVFLLKCTILRAMQEIRGVPGAYVEGPYAFPSLKLKKN